VVLARQLAARGLVVERQKVVAFEFDGMQSNEGLRIDLLIEGVLIVELKSVEHLSRLHGKQLLTYLRLLDLRLGLLINFGVASAQEGIRRVVNSRCTAKWQLPSAPDGH